MSEYGLKDLPSIQELEVKVLEAEISKAHALLELLYTKLVFAKMGEKL